MCLENLNMCFERERERERVVCVCVCVCVYAYTGKWNKLHEQLPHYLFAVSINGMIKPEMIKWLKEYRFWL